MGQGHQIPPKGTGGMIIIRSSLYSCSARDEEDVRGSLLDTLSSKQVYTTTFFLWSPGRMVCT